MIENQEEWDIQDRRLKDLFVEATKSGDKVNRYISHNEVMGVLFDKDPENLTHQFVEVPERGLVRNHSKSIRKCLEMLETMRHPDEKAKDSLRLIIEFLETHKPTKGRNTKTIAVGDRKTVRVNKNQGYILVPNVGQIFKLDTDENGKYDNQSIVVVYESDTEILIQKRTPLTDPDILDEL